MVSLANAEHKTVSPEAWTRALARAAAEHVVVFRTSPAALGVGVADHGAIAARPYTLAVVGERPQDVVCSCPASASGRLCKHTAAATFARKHGVYATAPAGAFDPSYDLPPSLQRARAGLR